MISLMKNYANLTMNECFVASVEALARKDYQEARWLADTCPRFSYQPIPDLQFSRSFDNLFILVNAHFVVYYKSLSRLNAVASGVDDVALVRYAIQLKGMMLAFEKFANYIGLSSDSILRATGHDNSDELDISEIDFDLRENEVAEFARLHYGELVSMWDTFH